LKYLGIALTNKNLIHKGIKGRLNLGNGCYHAVQNILPSCLLPKNIKIGINKPIILPVIPYGCEILSLTLREEHGLRVFENRVLKRILVPQRNEVTRGWRKLYNEEFHNLYPLPSIIRMIKSMRMTWVGHAAQIREKSNAYRLLVEKLEGKHHYKDQDKRG
jgi:hypothetical protein